MTLCWAFSSVIVTVLLYTGLLQGNFLHSHLVICLGIGLLSVLILK